MAVVNGQARSAASCLPWSTNESGDKEAAAEHYETMIIVAHRLIVAAGWSDREARNILAAWETGREV